MGGRVERSPRTIMIGRTAKLRELFDWPPNVTQIGVSLTRMAYAAAIFVDMAQVYRWRETSFGDEAAWVGRVALPLCMVALACFGAGLATRISAIASFGLLHVVYRHLPETYALDRITLLVLFVFMFAPRPEALAIDVRLRHARSQPLALVPAWFSLSLLLCIEIVYGVSVLYKFRSTVWRDGLAFWLPVTLPPFSAGRLPRALQNEVAFRALSYLALALETLFPLVLVRPLRRWIVLVGAGLHVGIALFLPIPLFGLGFAALYLALVDWAPLVKKLGWAADVRAVDSPAALAPRLIDRLPFALPAFLAGGELIAIVPARIVPATAYVAPYLGNIGLVKYGVYLDFHFTINKPILRFAVQSDGRTVDVPTFDDRGFPLVTGRYWCLIAIGDLRWHVGEASGDAAIHRYLRGALSRQGLTEAEFSVHGRDISIPLRMDPSVPDDVANRPWALLATGRYSNGRTEISWKPGAPITTAGLLP
jgi:hypothetical protein